MMEFLDKIYGYEHFGIILFAVIMVLVVLFVVILLLGKKDEKKREFEKTQALEKQNLDTFKVVNEEPVKVEVQENSEPVLAETPKEELTSEIAEEPVFDNVVQAIEEPVVEAPVLEPITEPTIQTVVEENPKFEEPIMEPVLEQSVVSEVEEPVKNVEIPNFNFDELAASIAKELSALEKLNQPEPTTVEEPKVEMNFEMPTPVVTPIENEVSVTPIEEVVKPNSRPVTFSSVYINKPAEPVVSKVEEPVKEAVVEPVVNVTPVAPMPHPSIELPKPAEMPILKDNSNEMPKAEPNVPDFSQFEGESYTLK